MLFAIGTCALTVGKVMTAAKCVSVVCVAVGDVVTVSRLIRNKRR